ncbi:MAG: hypothetical protein LAP40_16565 [Acidobacteriia bacterium]|nr:hypothetical protein [Terriglobia bacterium]
MAIPSADSRYCINSALAALLAAALFLPCVAWGQVTTGMVAGVVRASDGHPAGGAPVEITGGAGFRATIHANSQGAFTVALPYGHYRFSEVPVFVAPLQTTHVEIRAGASGGVRVDSSPGLWTDSTRARVYPEPYSLPGMLLSREPASVTEPLNFLGLGDNRLWLESQRAFSWTSTQYRIQGIDATDSYQPGRTMILPNVEALDEVVVQSASGQTAPGRAGTDIGLFLTEPGASWHGALTSADSGAPLSSSNLPPVGSRGLVQQSDRFNWFTRDGLDVGGPLADWADLFASAAGQWASQTVPLAAPGNDQRSRELFANVRGRVRAGARDQFEGEYVGSRIDLSDWGLPMGLEAWTGYRMAPSLILPGGFHNESEVDHLDFFQIGWTRQLSEASGLGALQIRYGYSTAHLDGQQTGHGAGPAQSRVELLDGAVTGAPPLQNFAIRTRHSMEVAWQPGARRTGALRHQIVVGGGWSMASPRNRFSVPSNLNLITANGVPSFVTQFNTPLDTVETVRSFSGYATDRVALTRTLALDVGARADISRGLVQGRPGTPIAWNTLSPRAGLAWAVPHARGLILRGVYFRVYAPLAGRDLDFANPNSLSGSEYQWIDRNADGFYQPGEQGPLLLRFGGLYSSVDPSLRRPYSDEFDLSAEVSPAPRTLASIHLFRRDDKARIAAVDVGVPPQAFTPVPIADPGPDGIPGTFDDQQLTVYQQNPATFGQDSYRLTNPAGLRMLDTGFVAEARTQWRTLTVGASFVAEKSYGPANPGDTPWANDPGTIGALFLDPNTAIHAAGRSFFDRAYVGKVQATYRLPWSGVELATGADYMDGLVFARQLLFTGLAQGPLVVATTVRGSPEGGNRAEHVTNWNLRVRRAFRLPFGSLTGIADVLNLTNAGHAIQESDLSGPSFNRRLPVAIQAPRAVRLGFRYDF